MRNGYRVRVGRSGTMYWNLNHELHRKDGPSVVYHAGDLSEEEEFRGGIEWYFNGKLHREDGPAIEYPLKSNSSYKEWHLNGKELTEEQYLKVISEGF